jgi:hypothetical protein
MLASRFGRGYNSLRTAAPMSDDQIREVAPSIFAEDKHESRSARYSYIPTSVILDRLRKEGFQPFMVAQSRVRNESKREHAKHMLRLRHASQITAGEANEIILLNSHDGTSSYQMLSGQFRFACANGLVCGTAENDIRVRHQGDIVHDVIDGAFRVVDDFERVASERDAMKSLSLNEGERNAFARGALLLRFGSTDENETVPAAPITERQILRPNRPADLASDLWTTFNVVQENAIRGGQRGRSANNSRVTTRAVTGIDQDVKLNRALWVLAEEMRKLKA